jgi:serine/threonine protein kinase/TPR repeat protein
MPETVSFEHYEVLTRDDGSLYELGRGAMGVTYKAFDTNLRVPVALKVINAMYLHSEVARQRFVREARSAAKLRHRNVATVYHLGTEGEAWFYAMEFIDGETLDALVKRHGPLEPVVALQIAAQVARALNAAVPHGLVHRDLKPANLMLVREDDDLMVKVIDFGLAKSLLPGEDDDHVGFVGTPHFASPEQLSEKAIDVRSDIYSLGVVLWFMLAARTPFTGAMEEVKAQHLTKPPPFEQLAKLPPPVVTLLRRMLEKDAAQRQQSPQELRRALEECIEQIDADATHVAEEEGIATLLEDAQHRAGETQFEPRAVIAGRYRIVEALGETNSGRVFRCHDRERQRDVRMLVLAPDLIADPAMATQLEREVEKIAAVHHENLLQILGLESIDGASFLTIEWTEGFSALELLRVRRELEADETLLLLKHAAGGADAALAAGLKRVDFALHQVFIHFTQPIDKEKLLRAPLLTWPPFTAKLNPLGITRELSASETWAGAQTMVQGVHAGEGTDIRARYVHALGAIAYELLGGTLNPLVAQSGAGHYTPLATLSEEGNEVLKRALDPARSFDNATEFFDALKGIEVLEIKRALTLPPPGVARTSPGSATASRTRAGKTTVGPRPRKKKIPVKFVGSLLTAGLIGAGVYFLSPRDAKRPGASSATPAESSDEPEVTPPADDAPPVTVDAPPKTLSPTDPTKLRVEALRAAIEGADATEREGDPEKAIAAWLTVAREFPESDAPNKRLDFVIDPLRKRPDVRKPEIFDALKPLLVEAAQHDVLSAVLLLAEAMRDRHLRESFSWYAYAAARGRTDAYLQMGLILSNGIDGARDPEKAVYYFKLAAENNDPDAKAALAECYLLGKGAAIDYQQGLRWINEAVEQGSLRAMNRLATGYDNGIYGLPKNADEAARLWTKVAETADRGGQRRQPIGEANRNLALLYYAGRGTKRDDAHAVMLLKEGKRLGDADSTFILGCFQLEGIGGLPKSASQGRGLIKEAASAGSRRAQEWCRANGIALE